MIVREMKNPNDPVKNIIISVSDLHLDSIWCKKENERIRKFIRDLVAVAKVIKNTVKNLNAYPVLERLVACYFNE